MKQVTYTIAESIRLHEQIKQVSKDMSAYAYHHSFKYINLRVDVSRKNLTGAYFLFEKHNSMDWKVTLHEGYKDGETEYSWQTDFHFYGKMVSSYVCAYCDLEQILTHLASYYHVDNTQVYYTQDEEAFANTMYAREGVAIF